MSRPGDVEGGGEEDGSEGQRLKDIFCKLFQVFETTKTTTLNSNTTDKTVQNHSNDHHQDDFTAWDYLVMGVYGLIVLISLFGNGLVFSVIVRTRRLHTITNLFIANLSLGDLLMTTFNIPFTVVR